MKSKLKFIDYVVNNIEFRNNYNYDAKKTKLDFDINSAVDFTDDSHFSLGLQVELFRDAQENNFPFNFKVEVIGQFEIEASSQEERMKYAEQNAVAILFPYVMALISTFTAASNVQPVILPPINVVGYLKEKNMSSTDKA